MKLRLALLAMVSIILFATDLKAQNETNIHSGELIVMPIYQQNMQTVLDELNQQTPGLNLKLERQLSKQINVWLLSFNDEAVSNDEALFLVSQHLGIHIAQFNHNNIRLRDTLPNDPQINNQWAFVNTDTTGANNAAGISAPKAWEITTGGTTIQGDDIVMAVIDGGFFINHQDIEYWTNAGEIPGNGQDDDGNGYIDDVNGWNAYQNSGNISNDSHGTHVAGTVAAKSNNGIGVAGVNWHGHVMAIQGSSGNESTVVGAYGFALDNRALYNATNGAQGAFVVSTNSSFGVDNANPANYPVWCAFYDSLGAYGIISCGATANNSVNIDQVGDVPTACPSDFLISVTNTDESDDRAFAGYGLTTIDLGAPGSGILSTYPNNNYNAISGTSMATPHVTGTVGLMISAGCDEFIQDYKDYPDSLALIIRQMILDNVDPVPGLANECVSGGRLNLYKSVKAVADYTCTPIVLNPTINDATCGNNDGSVTVNVTGNEGPVISYQWDDPNMQTTATASGLAAGSYTVVVVDSAGNSQTLTVDVINGNAPISTPVWTDLTCPGDGTGSASANVSGGTPAFTYQWDDPAMQTTETATGLDAGTYTVIISDQANCVVTSTVTISEPDPMTLSFSSSANTANPPNGSINITVFGGTPPYTYQWSNGSTSEDQTGLFQGEYSVIITDDNGCVHNDTFTVNGVIGIEELDGTAFTLYPNPTDGHFTIALEQGKQQVYQFVVTDALGRTVAQKQVQFGGTSQAVSFDLNHQPAGVYFLRISDENQQSKTAKIIVR